MNNKIICPKNVEVEMSESSKLEQIIKNNMYQCLSTEFHIFEMAANHCKDLEPKSS